MACKVKGVGSSVIALLACVSTVLGSGMGAAEANPLAALMGTWVQDQEGPILTYERVLRFRPDGSYEFLQGDRLVFTPQSGPRRAFPWRVERDPSVGDVRLVLVMPDGILDVYYRR
jgi:hypothetical protein